jgi:hypothetical protein
METATLRRAVRWIDRWLTSAGRRSCTGRSQQALRGTLARAGSSPTPPIRAVPDSPLPDDGLDGDPNRAGGLRR